MKTIAIVLSILFLGLGFLLGRQSRQSDYEAACHMSDVIRCYDDYLADTLVSENTAITFREICSSLLYNEEGKPVNLSKYSYCY